MTATVASAQLEKSTIVRLFSAPPAIRAAFWALERGAPAIGARWAERIWFTLPAPRRAAARHSGPGQRDRAAAGTRFTLDLDGHEIVGEWWGGGPAIYFMHGWAGHRGQLTTMVRPLVERGHRVVTFDAPSHGESSPGTAGPRSSSIPEFASALTAVAARFGRPHAIVAHSMGSTAAAAAVCDGLRSQRLVLLAPMASPQSYARQFAAMMGFGERVLQRLVSRVERRVGAPMSHFDVPELGRAVAMPPTLVIHDRQDTSTPVTDGMAIAAAWPGAELHLTSGLGHRRLLRDPDVVARVVDFVSA